MYWYVLSWVLKKNSLQTPGIFSLCSSPIFGTLSMNRSCLDTPGLLPLPPEFRVISCALLGIPCLCHILETLWRLHAGKTVCLICFSISWGSLSFITWCTVSCILFWIFCQLFSCCRKEERELDWSLSLYLAWKYVSSFSFKISYRALGTIKVWFYY